MKKIISGLLALSLAFSLSSPVFAADVRNKMGDTIAQVKVINDINYIPLRATVEYFGYGCQWNSKEGNITITNTRHGDIVLTPNKNTYEAKGFTWTMDAPVVCIDGVSYVDTSLFVLLGHTVSKVSNNEYETPNINIYNIYC